MSRDSRAPRRLRVEVDNLRIGMYVAELDRPWLETPFLFQGFPVRSAEDIDELKKHCGHVYIDPEQTDPATAEPVPSLAMTPKIPRQEQDGDEAVSTYKQVGELREDLAHARELHEKASVLIRTVMDDLQAGGRLDLHNARLAVEPIVESVMKSRSAMSWLARLREADDYLYAHSVSSAIWATVMARHLGLPRETVETAGLGALLLDVGKTRVPAEVLAKPGPLTEEEFALARRHVEHGRDILKEAGEVPAAVLEMVLTHHERHDGSGYPRGLSGHEIPVLGRIAGIVDYYDAVTSRRPYAEPKSSYDCLRAMNKMAGKAFQAEMVQQFIQSIGFFPPGTLVQLNDGSVAVVVAQNRRHRLKPEVLLMLDSEQRMLADFRLIDLQMQPRSDYSDEPLYIDRGLEAGSYGIDPAEYFLA